MKFRQNMMQLFAQVMTGKKRTFGILLPSGILFIIAALISRQDVSKPLWFGILLPCKLILLFLCLLLLVIYVSQSKDLLQKKISLRFGKSVLTIFLGLMLSVYLIRSFSINNGFSDYAASGRPEIPSFFTQAKIFAMGRINVASHELREFFQTSYCVNNGKYFSMYPPGWPLILSFGILFKLPWIVNPMLTCLCLYTIYLLGVRLYEHETAWIAIIFAGFSPIVINYSSSYLSEPASLLFSVLFFYAATRSLESSSIIFPVLSGFYLGFLFLVRPYSAVAICLPMAVYWVFNLARQPKLIWQGALLSFHFLCVAALHFAYNYYQTGSFWLLPLVYYNPFNKPGFGFRSPDVSIKPFYFGPLSALENLVVDLINLNWVALPLLFLFFLSALIGPRKKWDWLLGTTAISIIVFHFFYYHKGLGKFQFPALFAMFLLSARGVVKLEQFLKDHFHVPSCGSFKVLFVLFPLLVNIILLITPGYIGTVKTQATFPDPFLQVRRKNITNSIIFLKTVPEHWDNSELYIQNSPDFDDSVLFAKDLGPKNILLMRYYPNRTYYLYEFDRKGKHGTLTCITSASY